MIFHYLNYSKIFKIAALVFTLIIAISIVANIALSENPNADTKQQEIIIIDKIIADKQQKVINIWCSLPREDNIYEIDTTNTGITVSIRKKDMIFDNVYIKNIKKLSANKLLIHIQPPLKDALYGIEKRDFTVQFSTDENAAEVSKMVVLGSAIRVLDLRAYISSSVSKYIINALFLVLGLSLIFALIIPVLKKYDFKKYYIKKQQQPDDETKLDPFTFESIEENDQVVVIEDHVMLLRSWKRLYKLRSEKRIEALEGFFKEDKKNNLFKPETKTALSINRMWFGMIGAYIGWLIYVFLMNIDFRGFQNLLATVFDTESRQISSVFYGDLLLGAMLGMGVSAAFLTAEKLYGKHHIAVVKMLYRTIFGMIVLTMFFLIQSVLNTFLVNHNVLGNFLTWLCIGIGLGIIAGRHMKLRKILFVSGITALAGFISYQLCSVAITAATLSTELVLVVSLLIAGSLSGVLTYTEPVSMGNEALQHEDTNTVDTKDVLAVQTDK